MIRDIIRTAAAYIANTAYEDGRRDGAGLVPRRELEEARAEAKKLRESVANERSYRDSWELACSKVTAERDEWKARAEKAEAALKSQPAAYPWLDEAVERAADAYLSARFPEYAPGSMAEHTTRETRRCMRAALATLAPPPQAAPVPPVGVGDVWGEDVVRVVFNGDRHGSDVCIGTEKVFATYDHDSAEEYAKRIRRGLASLPPMRAVLVGGVTEGMVEAYIDAEHAAEPEGEIRAGLTVALAAANIRVLGPGEGVVRVRVAKDDGTGWGRQMVEPCVFWTGSRWFAAHDTAVALTGGTRYILAADLDAAAAEVGKGVES